MRTLTLEEVETMADEHPELIRLEWYRRPVDVSSRQAQMEQTRFSRPYLIVTRTCDVEEFVIAGYFREKSRPISDIWIEDWFFEKPE